ncbi:class I SAM-dependent methyltransferase [Oceanicoccus sp. KOV_DT_Chl]|uniref:class I SAM-dependent methyltransferase n=1 Tax=Oceanicoccus sp. KOV_DT_Chl TaxID=1904639 RepID=UPI000C7D1D61|nr:class I SAM-dependent methyltransferase [Oceanicoccus sp. KOV_DT_Chl]
MQRYYQDSRRNYFQCECCQLVFVDPAQRLTKEQEKAEYDLHQNSPADTGYRQFLRRLCQPMLAMLQPNSHGLDFGCGPGPTLSLMFEHAGHSVNLYDHFYCNNELALAERYDFICATEVIEHLFEPGRVLRQLWQLLKFGGVMGLMTKLVIDQAAFSGWHYKNDPTHVCFFSAASLQWLAAELGAEITIIGSDVIVLSKPYA